MSFLTQLNTLTPMQRIQRAHVELMGHPDTIRQICLCLRDVDPFHSGDEALRTKRFRTHVLVLELLAAVCLVPKGHPRILDAFEHYKDVRPPILVRFGRR